MDLWNATIPAESGQSPPFASAQDMYSTIDSTALGDIPWESFTVSYNGELPEANVPPWMTAEYTVWFRDPRQMLRDQLANPDFKDEIDFSPKRVFDKSGKRKYKDLMSGNWAWKQAVSNFHRDSTTSYIINIPCFRILYPRTHRHTDALSYPGYSGATKQLSQLLLAKTNTTHSTDLSEMYITMYVVHTVVLWLSQPFWLFLRVSLPTVYSFLSMSNV